MVQSAKLWQTVDQLRAAPHRKFKSIQVKPHHNTSSQNYKDSNVLMFRYKKHSSLASAKLIYLTLHHSFVIIIITIHKLSQITISIISHYESIYSKDSPKRPL